MGKTENAPKGYRSSVYLLTGLLSRCTLQKVVHNGCTPSLTMLRTQNRLRGRSLPGP